MRGSKNSLLKMEYELITLFFFFTFHKQFLGTLSTITSSAKKVEIQSETLHTADAAHSKIYSSGSITFTLIQFLYPLVPSAAPRFLLQINFSRM